MATTNIIPPPTTDVEEIVSPNELEKVGQEEQVEQQGEQVEQQGEQVEQTEKTVEPVIEDVTPAPPLPPAELLLEFEPEVPAPPPPPPVS